MPLSNFERQHIVAIHLGDIRKTPAVIQRIMQLEGTHTSHQAVRATIKRWNETGGYKDRDRSGRSKLIPNEHYRFINEAMEKNESLELTVSDLMEALQKKFGHEATKYSKRTLAKARQDLGWIFSTARYCQAIREGNKLQRLEWVSQRLSESETFDNVIFTDESWKAIEERVSEREDSPEK